MVNDKLLTTSEALAMLNCSPTLFGQIKGQLHYVRLGKRNVRYSEREIRSFIESRRHTPEHPRIGRGQLQSGLEWLND